MDRTDHDCFYCLDRGGDETAKMPCCGNIFHKKCHKHWVADHYYCGYCRQRVSALQPMTVLSLERLRAASHLLDSADVDSQTATIIGAGELVDDQELIRELQVHLGHCVIDIERAGSHGTGYEPGRLVKVTYKTQYFSYAVTVDPGHNSLRS